jgi:hypothetical protein
MYSGMLFSFEKGNLVIWGSIDKLGDIILSEIKQVEIDIVFEIYGC